MDTPFRVFADLSDEFGLVRVGNHFRTAILTATLVATIWLGRDTTAAWLRFSAALAADYYKQLLGLTVFGGILALLKNVPLVARFFGSAVALARGAERGLYRMYRR